MQKLSLKTDQNVPIEVELAGIGIRLVAVLIDVLFIGLYAFLMTFLLVYALSDSFDFFRPKSYDIWAFMFVFIVLLPFILYTPLMEYLTKGQTIGKLAMGIRVTKLNGENASFKDYFTRWIFRPYEAYFVLVTMGGPLLFIASFFFDTLISSISSKNQRIGDFMANTVVVRKRPARVYTIREVMSIRTHENYIPTLTGVSIFTDEDMMLVKNVITRVETYKNKASKELAINLANEIAERLDMDEPRKKLKFLKVVLNDYIVLTR